ncbi:MAG: ATP-binding cassette domain-containing protein [Cyanobacteria bacterium P01_A01_bin.84]
MSRVKAENFGFTYPGGEDKTLKDMCFSIEEGEVLGIIGPLGAGKTTLCMTIADFAPRIIGGEAHGKLEVNYSSSDKSSSEEKGVGMVFEDYSAQLVQLKVIDELLTPLLNQGTSEEEAREKADKLLQRVGLDNQNIENKNVWEISGGQQQRLAIAATLGMDTQLLILDNVMDKLDHQGKEKVRNIIKDVSGEKTLIVVDRNAELLLEIADRILVLVEGNIIAGGSPDEILRQHDLVKKADIESPLSLSIAKELGISASPLTIEELEEIVDSNSSGTESEGSKTKLNTNSNINLATQSPSLEGNGENLNSPSLRRETGSSDFTKWSNFPEKSNLHEVSHTMEKDFTNPVTSQIVGSVEKDSSSESFPFESNFGQTLVRIDNINYSYSDNIQALESLNIEIKAGEVHAVIGRSGAGKTTIIKHIAGLLKPSRGDVLICDTDTRKISVADLALKVGTVLQNPDKQISERTVRQEIGFPLKHRRYKDKDIKKQVSQACELVGIEQNLLEKDPILLPQGQRKLIAIASALVVDPQVLILDEPSVSLSATSRRKVIQLIKHLSQQGKAVFVVENDIDFITEVAHNITVLEAGKVVSQGSTQEIFAPEEWGQLEELNLSLPLVTQFAHRLGVRAFNFQELVSQLSATQKEV